MPNKIKVSAPGKLMLFGEHSVVYGKPCLVTAVNQRLSLKASLLKEPIFKLNAPDIAIKNYAKPLSDLGKGDIPKGAKFVEFAARNFFDHLRHPQPDLLASSAYRGSINLDSRLHGNDSIGISFETLNQFKSTFGFGSSSASAVCTVKALSEIFELNLSPKEIFDLSYRTVLDVQGLGSGFDLGAAIYGGTLYFMTGGKLIEPLPVKNLPLIVGYTGIKADTATIVREVKTRFEGKEAELDGIYNSIEEIVEQAKEALIKENFERVGELMNLNQLELEKLGVSSEKLNTLINAAKNSGAYGAKLSGAGGGDCMIALAPPNKKQAVEKAIEEAGGQVLKVEVNPQGVRLENE